MSELILAKYLKQLQLIAAAEESLYEFAKQAWSTFDSAPFVDGWHIRAICEHLEAVTNGDIKNLLINMPPRCMKTALVSVIWPAWIWIKSPGEQFFYIMSSQDIVDKASDDSKTLITSNWYQSKWGHKVKLSKNQNSKERWKNTANGFRVSCTILGKIVGKGGNYLVLDDPNNTRESDNDRKRIGEIWRSSIFNRVNDLKNAKRVVNMQRTHQIDLSGIILESEAIKDWTHLMLPMEFERDRRSTTVPLKSTNGAPWTDPRVVEKELLWPDKISRPLLQEIYRQIEYPYVIAGQYQQRPAPDEGGIIKKAWFKSWNHNVLPEIDHTIQSWDTAFSSGKDSKNAQSVAYSVCTTWGLFKNEHGTYNIILLGIWRNKVDFPELLDAAIKLTTDYRDDGSREVKNRQRGSANRPDTILIESRATGAPLMQELRRVGIACTPYNPSSANEGSAASAKERRVQLVSHLIKDGRVYLRSDDRGRFDEKTQAFVDECATFPNSAYKDQVDTLTQVLDYLRRTGWLEHSLDSSNDDMIGSSEKRNIYW